MRVVRDGKNSRKNGYLRALMTPIDKRSASDAKRRFSFRAAPLIDMR
jgi:hypothetical protein